MEGKTNFMKRLKQFDGLTTDPDPSPLFYDRSTSLAADQDRTQQAVREAAAICPRPLQVDL